MASADQPPTGPLAGLRVIELGTVLMVPYAGQTLGDLGADVIKVESEDGDPNRQVGPSTHPELSGVALNINRNKRSIVMDLRHPAGRETMAELVRSADVLITNFRPKALARLGLTYSDVAAWRPDIVYCASHGYRKQSGRADEPAYDDVIQASSGLASLSISARGEPSLLPTVLADKVSGLMVVNGVLAALLERERTGLGQEVEVPMFDAMVAFTLVEHLAGATMQPPVAATGYDRVLTPARRPHATSSGWIVVMPYALSDWLRLWSHLGRHDMTERLVGLNDAQAKLLAPQMYAELDEHLATDSTRAWLSVFADLDIAASEVATLDELARDGVAQGVLVPDRHPVVGAYLRIATPIRLGRPLEKTRAAPLVGADTDDILLEIGVGEQRLRELRAAGAVGAKRDQRTHD